MRRVIGLIMVGLGAFLVALALLVKFVAVPQLTVAPLDLDVNDPSLNEGVASELLDIAALAGGGDPFLTDVALTSTRYTKADVAATEAAGDNKGVYETFSRVNRVEGDVLVTAGTQRYEFDRTTSVLSLGSGANIDGEPMTEDMIGGDAILPLKFPFFVQQTTYNYFDTSLLRGTPVEFVEETQIDGLTVYKFVGTVEPTQIGIQSVPGSLVGSDEAAFEAPRFYTNTRELYVEPFTGQIVNGSEDQLQTLRGPDGTDAVTIIKGKLGFAPEEVDAAVDAAKENSSLVKTVSQTVPLVGVILGVVLLVVGLLLARRPSSQPAA